ncbi:MAG TPA: hypothetical protein VM867_07845 [Xanthobacteraceae bacterium]|jgi:hypothetical protein|nr:hypothetical protein [Xanthobacteraceae bacterium]
MMPIGEVEEAANIARRAADMLLATSSEQKGRSGSDLRRACGDLKTNAEVYILRNVIATKLAECFLQARLTGATLDEFNRIRQDMVEIDAASLVAGLIKNGCIGLALEQISLVLIGITFTSRDDVERVKTNINPAFDQAEETAADDMAQAVYQATITLHAAVVYFLYDTARPLPQMLDFRFGAPRPTLVLSHRLYDTAARADELREENKVVHPAFAPREGRALAH